MKQGFILEMEVCIKWVNTIVLPIMEIMKPRGNILKNNTVNKNVGGVSIQNSNYVMVGDNAITENETGIFIYENSDNNVVINNVIKNNKEGIYIKESKGNLVKDSLKKNENKLDIKVDSYSDSSNLIQKIE